MYRQLDPDRIIATAERLCRRISERFPESDLARVGDELLSVARDVQCRTEAFARPLIALRVGLGLVVVVLVGTTVGTGLWVALQSRPNNWTDFAQGIDAGLNVVIVVGAALLSLVTLERRIKRRRVLKAVHELRVLAHIVELHQLTKDPDRLMYADRSTASSPPLEMTAFQLTRYLDYCSEMLALIGNLAALYAARSEDAVVLDAIDAIESLTSAISAKIWQKIVIINTTPGPVS
jgi:hypothetical protein